MLLSFIEVAVRYYNPISRHIVLNQYSSMSLSISSNYHELILIIQLIASTQGIILDKLIDTTNYILDVSISFSQHQHTVIDQYCIILSHKFCYFLERSLLIEEHSPALSISLIQLTAERSIVHTSDASKSLSCIRAQ